MTNNHPIKYIAGLVNELHKLPSETEWVEFKHNNDNHEEIGEYISALSNSAALQGKVSAYMLWGIDNISHDVIGTSFNPSKKKVGSEQLESWFLHLLSPKINFRFFEYMHDRKKVILLEIGAAFRHPVQFKNIEEKNSAMASRIIKETLEAGMILCFDEKSSRRYMKYIPWWAR